MNDWRRSLSPARRSVFDVFLDRVAKMDEWRDGICDSIKGQSGFLELRWTAEKVEHRVFGYDGTGKAFVMLVGCTHKGKVYNPPEVFETMKTRAAKIKNGEGTVAEYDAWLKRRNAG